MNARTPRAALAAIAVLAAVALSACSPSTSGIPQSTGGQNAVGTWASDEEGQPQLVLGEDLTVTGSDGCNGITTTYRLDGGAVEFDDFMSTLKACPGVDTWLSAVKTASIDGETMTVRNRAGDEIGVLQRVS